MYQEKQGQKDLDGSKETRTSKLIGYDSREHSNENKCKGLISPRSMHSLYVRGNRAKECKLGVLSLMGS